MTLNVINNFRAHVLGHSSAAMKIDNFELANKIVSVKQKKCKSKVSTVVGKIISDNTSTQAKAPRNTGKLHKLLDKQNKYEGITMAIAKEHQAKAINAAGNLGASINELSSTRPNLSNILTSVQTFIEESNQAWSELNADKPNLLLDAGARSAFNQRLITEQLDQMPTSSMQQAYEQLDGQFGDRMRGIMEFSAAQVGLADITDVMTSEALKYSTVIDGLMDSLNLKLNPGADKPLGNLTYVSNIAQLNPLEQAALSRIGITKEILELSTS